MLLAAWWTHQSGALASAICALTQLPRPIWGQPCLSGLPIFLVLQIIQNTNENTNTNIETNTDPSEASLVRLGYKYKYKYKCKYNSRSNWSQPCLSWLPIFQLSWEAMRRTAWPDSDQTETAEIRPDKTRHRPDKTIQYPTRPSKTLPDWTSSMTLHFGPFLTHVCQSINELFIPVKQGIQIFSILMAMAFLSNWRSVLTDGMILCTSVSYLHCHLHQNGFWSLWLKLLLFYWSLGHFHISVTFMPIKIQ